MLYVIAGPSGSGKTTFIRMALKSLENARVINVDVFSTSYRKYENDLGRKRITQDMFIENQANGKYEIINKYDNNIYGYTIPSDHFAETTYFLDYPGEYPLCIELKDYNWRGILILPSSISVLVERLEKCCREWRICSATIEYLECIDDIKNGVLSQNWLIIYNNNHDDLLTAIQKISHN